MGNSAQSATPSYLTPQSDIESQHNYFEEAIVFNEYPFRIQGDKLKEKLHRSVGALTFLNKNKKINAGSAALISKDVILTCAHNLYDKYSDSHNSDFKFYIGANGVAQEYYEIEAWRFPQEFKACHQSNKLEFDYGVIKLKRPVLLDEYLPLSPVCQECTVRDNQSTKVMVYGFPLYKQNFMALDEEGNKMKLYQYGLTRKNRIINIEVVNFKMKYSISTLPGQSGCPVAIENRIVAVHVGGDMAESNLGRIVDASLLQNLTKWVKQLNATPFDIVKDKCMHKQQAVQNNFIYIQQTRNQLKHIEGLKKQQRSKRKKKGCLDDGHDYLSSGLQCIFHIKELSEYFLSKRYIDQINKTNPLGTQGKLSISFAETLQELLNQNGQSVSLISLRKEIQKFQPMFAGSRQHDSKELIEYFLDGLHEDLNRIKKKPYVETKDYDGRPDKIVAKQAWENFLKRNQSVIVDLLYGQHKSIMNCQKCQVQSITFDSFYTISLPLIRKNSKDRQLEYIGIDDCFEFFQQAQILDEQVQWYCPKCKDFVVSKKQMFIYKAPKIMIVSLKRVKAKGQKNNILVRYPLRGLDLSKYVLNPDLPQQQQGKGGKLIYDLISVCNHVGNSQRGHYTAYCKDFSSDEWYEFDGNYVSKVKDSQVVSPSAYILYYRRRD